MLVSGGLDLPSAVLAAQQDGSLVVFAGAGVSIPTPSGLPTFEQLANDVAHACGSSEAVDDPTRIEEFLGDLEESGAAVHETVKRLISDPRSKPNQLHRALVELFDDHEPRIVTTNFDCHFEGAYRSQHKETEIPNFSAPAMPLGNDFTGVVHLHGSVTAPARHLVLTDADFGRAYLTHAWATRFLISLYEEFTVLFVGYSHNDPVMKYISRGLASRRPHRRFALSPDSDRSHWRRYGIVPLPYKLEDAPDRHKNLRRALVAWSRISHMGLLDHEKRVRDLAGTRPPADPELVDYLLFILGNDHTARYFTEHASGVEWLRWAEDNQLLATLLDPAAEAAPRDGLLAGWFAERFVRENHNASLGVIQRGGGRLHPRLWHAIAFRLWTPDWHGTAQERARVLGTWVPILMNQVPPDGNRVLTYLLVTCDDDELVNVALFLLRHLLTPVPDLRPYFGFLADDADVPEVQQELVFHDDHFHLNEAWMKVFKPRLETLASPLVEMTAEILHNAHLLDSVNDPGRPRPDTLSFRRSAIEAHQQDEYPEPLDVLVDIARDALEHQICSEPERAERVIDQWASSKVPLLRRLAVHGIGFADWLTPNHRLAAILVDDWLFNHSLKHEVFRLLAQNFSKADDIWQRRLIERAQLGPTDEDAHRLEPRTRDYVKYNLLVWIGRAAPQTELARRALEQLQQEHPDFAPREHPDLDIVVEDVEPATPASPVTVDELLRTPLDDGQLEFLVNYQPDPTTMPWSDRSPLLRNVSIASGTVRGWGFDLAGALSGKEAWTSDLWRALVSSWSEQPLTAEEWGRALRALCEHQDLGAHLYEVTSWVDHGLKSSPGVPDSHLEDVEHLLENLWQLAHAYPSSFEFDEDHLTEAINLPEGRVILALLRALSRRRRITTEWDRLPDTYRRIFGSALEADTSRGGAAFTLLPSQVQFLLALDREWTEQHVIPTFDWSRSNETAERAWHGLAAWGQLNGDLVKLLEPQYQQTFGRLTNLGRHRTRFIQHLALITVSDAGSGALPGWITTFLASSTDDDRASLARQLALQFKSLSDEAGAELWNGQMKAFVLQRRSGLPVALSANEAAELGEWPLSLPSVFVEAVETVVGLPPRTRRHSLVLDDLVNQERWWTEPDVATKYLTHRLKGFEEPFWQCPAAAAAIRKAHVSGARTDLIRAACDALAGLGCGEAPRLRDELLP